MKTLFSSILLAFLAMGGLVVAQQAPTDQTQQQQNRRGPGGREFRGTGGEITAISGSTLTIKLRDGSTGTVNTTSTTRFHKDQQDAKLSDFKVGDTIFVRGDSTGDKTWAAQMIASAPSQAQIEQRMKDAMGKTMVVGDVKSLDPPKITIHRVDGVDQTIEADENTEFRRGRGEDITLPDIKTGDTVFARGELKNGVFIPTDVNVVPPELAQRMKESGGLMMFGGGTGQRQSRAKSGTNGQAPPQQNPQL
jgi:Cu/Ag efflux protein CusF